MRIISGERRGTLLYGPEVKDIRPTTDRAKESLFNIINTKIINSTFLDLFSGSGAIALEAKSRGAKEVIAVDMSIQSKALINKNINKTNLNIQFVYQDVFSYINKLSSKFDIIFLDPPFSFSDDSILQIVNNILTNSLLEDDGYIIVERAYKKENEHLFEAFENVKIKKYGKVSFIFIGKR